MKLYRLFYWITMLCALLAGLYTGNRFSWLLFLILAFLLAAALGINIWTILSFSYLQTLGSPQGEKGQTVSLHLGIYNDKPFPFTHMRVWVQTPAENQVLTINLAPKTDCSFDLSLALPRRGAFLVGMTFLELQDVFGLLPLRFDLRHLPYYRQKELLVLPRVRDFALPAAEDGTQTEGFGGQATARAGQEELGGLRNWQAGDSLSRVHWKASAKTRQLLLRQYEEPTGGTYLIFLDCRLLESEILADQLIECAATLAYAHLARGDTLRLLAGGLEGKQPEKAASLTAMDSLRQWLALVPFRQKSSGEELLASALEAERPTKVYVLGGQVRREILQILGPVPHCCWTAEPLPAGMEEPGVQCLGERDVLEFLRGSLGEKL